MSHSIRQAMNELERVVQGADQAARDCTCAADGCSGKLSAELASTELRIAVLLCRSCGWVHLWSETHGLHLPTVDELKTLLKSHLGPYVAHRQREIRIEMKTEFSRLPIFPHPKQPG